MSFTKSLFYCLLYLKTGTFYFALHAEVITLPQQYLGYLVFKSMHDTFFYYEDRFDEAGNYIEDLEARKKILQFRSLNQILHDERHAVVSPVAYAGVCGYVAYKLLEVVIKNAPIVIKGKN
jgi:hypothetical protein